MRIEYLDHVSNNTSTVNERIKSRLYKKGFKTCQVCGWVPPSFLCPKGEPWRALDLHHVIQKSKGGTDDHSNLLLLCPNHHRLAHFLSRRIRTGGQVGLKDRSELLQLLCDIDKDPGRVMLMATKRVSIALEGLK